MTKPRRYGEDTPFGQWLRDQRDLDSRQHAFTANDADWIFHQYRPPRDTSGTRNVQLMMFCEVRTYAAVPADGQLESLYFIHQLTARKSKLLKMNGTKLTVWSFGAFVLSLSGTRPDESTTISWGRFVGDRLAWSALTTEQLKEILGFQRRPDTLTELSLRRHHRNREAVESVETPWGTRVDVPIIHRS